MELHLLVHHCQRISVNQIFVLPFQSHCMGYRVPLTMANMLSMVRKGGEGVCFPSRCRYSQVEPWNES